MLLRYQTTKSRDFKKFLNPFKTEKAKSGRILLGRYFLNTKTNKAGDRFRNICDPLIYIFETQLPVFVNIHNFDHFINAGESSEFLSDESLAVKINTYQRGNRQFNHSK